MQWKESAPCGLAALLEWPCLEKASLVEGCQNSSCCNLALSTKPSWESHSVPCCSNGAHQNKAPVPGAAHNCWRLQRVSERGFEPAGLEGAALTLLPPVIEEYWSTSSTATFPGVQGLEMPLQLHFTFSNVVFLLPLWWIFFFSFCLVFNLVWFVFFWDCFWFFLVVSGKRSSFSFSETSILNVRDTPQTLSWMVPLVDSASDNSARPHCHCQSCDREGWQIWTCSLAVAPLCWRQPCPKHLANHPQPGQHTAIPLAEQQY